MPFCTLSPAGVNNAGRCVPCGSGGRPLCLSAPFLPTPICWCRVANFLLRAEPGSRGCLAQARGCARKTLSLAHGRFHFQCPSCGTLKQLVHLARPRFMTHVMVCSWRALLGCLHPWHQLPWWPRRLLQHEQPRLHPCAPPTALLELCCEASTSCNVDSAVVPRARQ